ncbi:DUF4239 domain-containing protein [Aquabacter sp. L1I39]|uniref:bestrophin-like domain n=1 Tax=Aquabacter sp. L1I39 TaxID=2820278 RepID=UPI001AD9AF89|nr:DUF4239 domain-containing protein [Aquabacter sp. L1I39]QTL05134.1 DUF4239 domain-containing protein [Aquabacter sp. L1I39]
MAPWLTSLIVFIFMFGGALGALFAARKLPEHHVSKETQDTVKLGVGMIAAMASLILGLMTASVKGGFDTTDKDVHTYALNILTVDTYMRHYGPGSCEARALLRRYTQGVIQETWRGADDSGVPDAVTGAILLDIDAAVRGWTPQNDDQRAIRSSVLDRLQGLLGSRWTISQEAVTNIPTVFVVVLIIWLTLIFVSFGLFAPRNAVVVGSLLLCSMSIAGALFIILEMSGPFDGLITVQPIPLIRVLDVLTLQGCATPT